MRLFMRTFNCAKTSCVVAGGTKLQPFNCFDKFIE